MHIGKTIKLHRIRKAITQKKLAAGLISVSYLSKIENGVITPHDEIINELMTRLGISNEPDKDEELIAKIKEWYQTMITKEKERSCNIYRELEGEISDSSSFETNALFNLMLIRYYLSIGKITDAIKVFEEVSAVSQSFNNEYLYFYYKFKGNIEYMNQEFEKSFDSYIHAEKLLEKDKFYLYERGEVYYSLGLAASRLLKPYAAISYTKSALKIFREVYHKKRSSDCHLLLGLLFQRIREFDSAGNHYEWAKKLAEEEDSYEALGIIEHNIGYLYYLQEDYSKALTHYKKSLSIKPQENINSLLITIICILKVCYQNQDFKSISSWVQEAKKLNADKINDQSLLHEITVFELLTTADSTSFTNYIEKTALPYFQERKNYPNLLYYSEILAQHYKKKRKYKQSMLYFEYGNTLLKEKINITFK